MKSYANSAALLPLLVVSAHATRLFTVVNNCPYTIWLVLMIFPMCICTHYRAGLRYAYLLAHLTSVNELFIDAH